MNKRGQIGFVVGLVGAVAFLVIGIIIAFTVVGTLGGDTLLEKDLITNINESDATGAIIGINQTSFNLNGTAFSGAESFAVIGILADYNQSNGTDSSIINPPMGYNVTVAAANFTLNSNGTLSNATNYVFPNVSVNYTYLRDTSLIRSANNLSGNFSEGVDNVAEQIPTVLLIGAIILILGIIAVLWGLWQRTKFGTGTSL